MRHVLWSMVLLAACTEDARLASLPPEIQWAVVVRSAPGAAEETSPLLRVEDGALALAVEPDQTLDVWGFGAEVTALVAPVPATALETTRLRDAAPCEPTLPRNGWSARVTAGRGLAQVPAPRAWTASWLEQQCPTLDPSALRVSASCALSACGTVRVDGCALEADATSCGLGVIRGRVQPSGELCLIAPQGDPTFGTCQVAASGVPGALSSLACIQGPQGSCEVDVLATPQLPPVAIERLQIADPAPDSVGPDDNDYGIYARNLLRMRAVNWTPGQMLVTWWPWSTAGLCRRGDGTSPTSWSLVDTRGGAVVQSGTTTHCIRELARAGERDAVALSIVRANTWALTRITGQPPAETQRRLLDDEVRRFGVPHAMRLDADGHPVVLYARTSSGVAAADHTYVRHDRRTFEPAWVSSVRAGVPTHMVVQGRTAWIGEASGRAIDTMELDTGQNSRRYIIPDLPREPLELGGLYLPDPVRRTELIAIVLRDMPGLLVTSAGTRHLTWYPPFHREDAIPTIIASYRDEPTVFLMARSEGRAYQTFMVTVNPVARRWNPGFAPVDLRLVSELVHDDSGRAWLIAPWDGVIARLP